MNPLSATQPAPQNPMRDISPAKADASPATPIKAEIVTGIPVKAPAGQAAQTPTVNAPTTHSAAQGKSLDIILKDVTQAVKQPIAPSIKFAAPAKMTKQPSHLMPIVIAILFAALLATAAYYSYRGPHLS